MTTDLVDFVRARVAEDRAAAEAATAGPWGIRASEVWWISQFDGTTNPLFYGDQVAECVGDESDPATAPNCEHICRWDPARVIAECEAKLAIIDLCADRADLSFVGSEWPPGDETELAAATLAHLAAPYASHPDYIEAWKQP